MRTVVMFAILCSLPAALSAQQPTIYFRGIVNAASLAPAGLPSGGIARGSAFLIRGNAFGPAVKAVVSSFPIDASLSGVSVRVMQGAVSVNALPLSVSPTEIVALMPSNAPLGMALVRVTYNNIPTNPERVRIVESSPGLFSVTGTGDGPGSIRNVIDDDNQPANSTQVTAIPGQTVTVDGTGLGALSGPDNQPPPQGSLSTPVQVIVGGMPANVLSSGRDPCCAGKDIITFQLPDNVPTGCWVPVYVRAGGVTSNAITLAIDADGMPCAEPSNPLAATFLAGGNVGILRLLRSSTRMDVDVQPALESANDFFHFDLAHADGGENAFSQLFSQPPAGSCTVFFAQSNLFKATATALPPGRALDAGPTFTLMGPRGLRGLTPAAGAHAVLLGSFAPVLPSLPNQLTLDPGEYTITAPGGTDVGSFTAAVTLSPAFRWTNRDLLTSIDRSQPLQLSWTGVPPGHSVTIRGIAVDRPTNSSSVFYCTAAPDAAGFTVPAAVLSVLPASRSAILQSQSAIYLMTATTGTGVPFDASGLDSAIVTAGHLIGKTVLIQ